MTNCPDIWNVLHDGTIVAVAGEIPGELTLEIEADYLRRRFDERGRRFVLTLRDCTHLIFKPWDESHRAVTRLEDLAALSLWILSADNVDGRCAVRCSRPQADAGGGVLEVVAEDAVLRLDTGRIVSTDEIEAVAEEYWTEWSSGAPE
jgi:hypothetical protein